MDVPCNATVDTFKGLSAEDKELYLDGKKCIACGKFPAQHPATTQPTTQNPSLHDDGDIVIFACEQMLHVAEAVAKLSPRVHVGQLTWEHFPDGFPDIYFEDAHKLKWVHGVYLASLSDPSTIFEQMAVIYALPRLLVRSLRVVVPYFSTGTMERVATIGEVATAKTLSRLLSAIPPTVGGPSQVCLFDLHTLQNQFYFTDSVIIRMHSCVNLLLRKMESLEDCDNIAIAFPDDGAAKRFKSRFAEYPIIICDKVREGDKRIVKIKDGDAKGKHVVIVDDLVQSGGTLLNCAVAVNKQGATAVSCFCTHAVFPKDAHLKFFNSDVIKNFWVTDTNPNVTNKLSQPPFEVLSIASRVWDVIADPLDFADRPEDS